MNKRNWTIGISTALALMLTLTACGNDTTEEPEPFDSKLVQMSVVEELEEPKEEELEIELVDKDVWVSEDGSETITIDEDAETVTIDYEEEEVPFWVGSYEPEADEWTSEKMVEEEQVAECDTIEFTWSGNAEDIQEALTYSYEDSDGNTVSNTLNRQSVTEAIVSDDSMTAEEVEEITGVAVSDIVVSDTAKDNKNTTTTTNNNEETSASPSASNSKNSDTASANDTTSASASASTGNNSNNDSSDKSGSTTSSGSNSGNSTGSSGSTSNSSSSNSSSSNSGSSSSGSSSGSSSNSSSGSSSSGSSSSGTTTTACSHNYQGVVTKNATCSSAGVKQYTCSKCGASYTESIPATGHSYNGGVVTKAATCSTAGTTTFTCTKCGNSYTNSIPATGNHNWQAVYRTESVKVQDAVYEYRCICNNCFNYSSRDKGEVFDHIYLAHGGVGGFTYGNVLVQDAVYENQQVLDHYVCSVCGATK